MAFSLRTKLIVPLLFIGALFAVLGAWVLNWVAEDHMRWQSVERSRLLAVAINETVEVMSELQEIRFAVEDIVASEEGISGISVVTRDPFVIWASSIHPGVDDDHASQQMLKVLMESIEQGTFGHYLLPGGDIVTFYPLLSAGYNSQNYRDRFHSRVDPQVTDQAWGHAMAQVKLSPNEYRGVVYLRLDSSAIRAGAADIFVRSGMILILAVFCICVLGYAVFHHSVLRPIGRISDTIQRQKAGETSTRLALNSDDEIGALGASFNNMLDAISERDQRLRTVVDNLPVALSLKAKEGGYQLINDKFSLWFRDLLEVSRGNPSEAQQLRLNYEKQVRLRQTDVTFEETIAQIDGSYRHFTTTIFPLLDGSGKFAALGSASTDISERKAAEQEVRMLAYFDSLTGLPNRSLFGDRLQQALKSAERNNTHIGLLFMDLDGFKSVNDTLGHQIGDLLLEEVSLRLSQAVRAEDTVARMGGDEFIVLVVDLQEDRAKDDLAFIANKIRSSVASPMILGEHQTFVTCSVGIAIYPEHAVTAEELVIHADIAMYHAKNSGRDAFQFFQPGMNAEMHERRQIEDQLRMAMENHELSVAYQPKVDTLTGELIGAEALLRWNNPLLGEVPPLKFIPIAEDCGLIIPIGEWVIETVVDTLKLWREQGLDMPRIAINLSPRQLRDQAFSQRVQSILNAAGLSPDSLEFEITEGVFLQEVEHSQSSLYRLRECGVGLAIDDFGTGFSSLSYLKKLPVSSVKIDKTFVDGLSVDPVDEDIVSAIVAMAHSMHLTVVAEGVETQEQYDFLRGVHCDAAQGWLTGMPMSQANLSEWLQQREPHSETSIE